jgi:hypothetical protein
VTSRRAGERITPGFSLPRRAVRHAWWIVAAGIVLVSAGVVRWAGTRPSYDAYGWLVWGHQTLHLSLDLGGAPSWKPLPYLFTVPYALFGHLELILWMVTAVSLSLAGSVFAGRIAYRVVAASDPDTSGWPAMLAAVFAGAAVLALQDFSHYVLSVQSDPVIVTLTLAAIDCHLCGRQRWAFWLGVLGALGRPEAWCLLGPYTAYLWLRRPELRWMAGAGWALILFMWFGVPTITNDRPFVSAQLAMGSPRALRQNQITGTIQRFMQLYDLPLWLASAGTVVWAVLRRCWPVIVLAAGAALWVLTEIAFSLHGWPALPRYMFEAGAICGVIAAIGFGWLLTERSRLGHHLPRLVGPALAIALIAVLLPDAKVRYDIEYHDLKNERARAGEIEQLRRAFAALGGIAHIKACGQPTTGVEYASALAYYMQTDVGFVGYRPAFAIRRGDQPIVVFTQIPGGWRVRAWHTAPAMRGACSELRAFDVIRRGHPDGELIRY